MKPQMILDFLGSRHIYSFHMNQRPQRYKYYFIWWCTQHNVWRFKVNDSIFTSTGLFKAICRDPEWAMCLSLLSAGASYPGEHFSFPCPYLSLPHSSFCQPEGEDEVCSNWPWASPHTIWIQRVAGKLKFGAMIL